MHGHLQLPNSVLDMLFVWLLVELLTSMNRAGITIKLARHRGGTELASALGHWSRGYSVVEDTLRHVSLQHRKGDGGDSTCKHTHASGRPLAYGQTWMV